MSELGVPVADDHLLIGALCGLTSSRWPPNVLASAAIISQGAGLFGHFEEVSLLLLNSVHQVHYWVSPLIPRWRIRHS